MVTPYDIIAAFFHNVYLSLVSIYVFFIQYAPLLWQGFLITLQISAFSIMFGVVLGVFAALMKISSNVILRSLATGYIEIFRGTPLVVQILFIAFGYPLLLQNVFNVNLVAGSWNNPTGFWKAIMALSLNTGAYQAEIIRAGISSIPKGQMEAARSVGLTYGEAMRHIILPQAFRIITPPLTNEFINIVLNSSLVILIPVQDLTFWGNQIVSATFRVMETWTIVGGLYFSMTLLLSRLFQYLEEKYRIPGVGFSTKGGTPRLA